MIAIGFSARADNGLWVDGKDHVDQRVNTDAKALSPDAFLKVTDRVNQAVVNISTTQVIRNKVTSPKMQRRPGPPNKDRQMPPSPFDDFFFGDDFFEKFFNAPYGQAPQQERRQQSLGSGFILNADGYIVTNNHVVERADEIKVVLDDDSEFEAKVVGRDAKTDVALLKIDPKEKKLQAVVLGDSDVLKVGEVVVAIGNPFGFSHTVTQGIVSAKERSIGYGPYDDFIQTDASINPGNSGGPLLNLYGEVIGINSAIIASAQGIGFAIPINLAKGILLSLKSEGKVVRGWLGVLIQKITEEHAKALKLPNRQGALVSEIQEGSPAAKAGIKAGDVITRFNGKPIEDWNQLPIRVAETPIGSKVEVNVFRDGKERTILVVVEALKEQGSEAAAQEEPGKSDRLGLTVETLTTEIARSLNLDPNFKGVVVSDVQEDSQAYAKGIRQGDVIVELDRKRIGSAAEYKNVVDKLKKGNTVLMLIKRGPSTIYIAFNLM